MYQAIQVYRRFSILLLCLLCGLMLSTAASAQAVRPLSEVLVNMQGSSWSDVQDRAAWDGQNDGPLYPSAPENVPAYEVFEGDWTPGANAALAVFSDDGVDLYIDGAKVHSRKGQGQALPNLSQSLHRVSYQFEAGRTYRLRLEYSNTVYQGTSDIDGASIFVFTDDQNQGVKVTFISGLIGGVVRACAGAVGNDGVHSAIVEVLAKQAGQNLPNAALTFSFENNVGNPKIAKFINEQGQQVDTLTRTTNSEAKASLTVLSSDTISQPKIVAKYEGEQVGSITCNFAEAVSYRRFPNWINPDETEDTGWLFGQNWLNAEGNETTAKVYMKFMVDPSKGDIDGNWKEVNGHKMLFKVDSVDVVEGAVASPSLADYASLVSNQADGTTVHSTASDGAATAVMRAGSNVGEADTIWLIAYDQTQKAQ